MNVQNIMESIVENEVNKLYEEAKKENASWLSCDCSHCRLDTVCYVLNRIPPKYIVSSRGITHSFMDWNEHQVKADLDTIAMEGMKIVSSSKRPFHSNDNVIVHEKIIEKPAFNFSTFVGSVIDGSTFEPIVDAKIILKCNGKVAEMIDKTWSNPYITYKGTKGNYSFWLKPDKAETEGEHRVYKFKIEASADGYTPVVYNFEVPFISDSVTKYRLDSTFSLKIKDIVLFREDIINDMEE